MSTPKRNLRVKLLEPHPKQAAFVDCEAKRIVVKAGRRGGKTIGVATRAVKRFLKGRRILYAAPTMDQVERFWVAVNRALAEPVAAGLFVKNETTRTIELLGTDQRIRAKTAWNADSLRGDFCHDLILDEFQLMDEGAWNDVGAPMLIDNNGDAVFVFTPPSLHSRSTTKARDPQHATKFFRKAVEKEKANPKRWATFHFTSKDNPHVSAEAITELAQDMTELSYRIEILGEDIDEAPGALWTRDIVEASRMHTALPGFDRIVVAVDPSASSTGDEAGVITAGRAEWAGYVLEDNSVQGSPTTWATAAVQAYHRHKAACIVAEANNGGEMVRITIHTVDPDVPVRLVHAARGKATRAEPVAALFEVTEQKPRRRGFFAGTFPLLEDELCLWQPGDNSPNRLDAMVWAFWELLIDDDDDGHGDDNRVTGSW